MSEESNTMKKRAAKRYFYHLPGICSVNGQTVDIQILNISTSGIQFASRTKIETQEPIRLIWTDPDPAYGIFEATFLIAREIHQPDNKEYQYYYGSQYYNLASEIKDKLLILLKKFKEENKKESQEQVEKITPQYLFDVIDQAEEFLRKMFLGEPAPRYFDTLISEIKEYEKTAFLSQDDLSFALQKITTHNFHFNLLGMLAVFMVEKNDLQSLFFQHIQTELEKVKILEATVEEIGKTIASSSRSDEDKKEIQRKINESNNRLFYTKQGFLQSVVETFVDIDNDSVEFRESLAKIKEEYDRILDFTGSLNVEPQTHLYERRSKRPPKGFAKIESIVDLPIIEQTRPNYILWLVVALVLSGLGIFGLLNYKDHKKKEEIAAKIGMQIAMKDYASEGTQCNITVKDDDWKQLPIVSKDDAFQKIVRYLKYDPIIQSCTLYDDRHRIIKILFEDSRLKSSEPGQVVEQVRPKQKELEKLREKSPKVPDRHIVIPVLPTYRSAN